MLKKVNPALKVLDEKLAKLASDIEDFPYVMIVDLVPATNVLK
jgi:hypothetical protein